MMPAHKKLAGRDWVEAASLRATDPKVWTYTALAERFGMTASGIRYALMREQKPRRNPCLTPWGYNVHRARGERACLSCLDAHARIQKKYKARRGSGSVPVGEVRAVLMELLGSGWTITELSRASGLSRYCLEAVRAERYGTSQLRTLRALQRVARRASKREAA